MLLEFLAIGIILLVVIFLLMLKGLIKGATAFALLGFGFLFVLIALEPLKYEAVLVLLSLDVGLIAGAISKMALPRLYILIGLLGAFLTFILLGLRVVFA